MFLEGGEVWEIIYRDLEFRGPELGSVGPVAGTGLIFRRLVNLSWSEIVVALFNVNLPFTAILVRFQKLEKNIHALSSYKDQVVHFRKNKDQ